jgi:hypothetical protein
VAIPRRVASVSGVHRRLFAPIAVLATSLALLGCGNDTPDTDGGLSAKELAAKLPDGGTPQAAAVDVDAAREAARLPADADPTEISTSPRELRFGLSTFFALRDLAALTDNPVRAALDHGLISAYAAHPYVSDEAVTLLSTSQDFDELAQSLEDEGWERDGDTVSTSGDPEELTYTAVGAADGFVVLGYSTEAVEAVADGDSAPSETGELEALDGLDAPVVAAVIPEGERAACLESVTFEDFVDGTFALHVNVEGKADVKKVSPELRGEAASTGFKITSERAQGGTVTLDMEAPEEAELQQLVNSPAVLVAGALDENGPLLYDCG